MSEFDKSEYHQINSPGTPDCLGLRTAILKAIGKSDRLESLERFIAQNCANCQSPNAIYFDQNTDDIWLKNNISCDHELPQKRPNYPDTNQISSPLDDQ